MTDPKTEQTAEELFKVVYTFPSDSFKNTPHQRTFRELAEHVLTREAEIRRKALTEAIEIVNNINAHRFESGARSKVYALLKLETLRDRKQS